MALYTNAYRRNPQIGPDSASPHNLVHTSLLTTLYGQVGYELLFLGPSHRVSWRAGGVLLLHVPRTANDTRVVFASGTVRGADFRGGLRPAAPQVFPRTFCRRLAAAAAGTTFGRPSVAFAVVLPSPEPPCLHTSRKPTRISQDDPRRCASPPPSLARRVCPVVLSRRAMPQIYCTHNLPSWSLPWQRLKQEQSTSTGFVIDGRRIITNAHSVEYSTMVQVGRNARAA